MNNLNLRFEQPAPYSMEELAGSPLNLEYSRKIQRELDKIFVVGLGEAGRHLVTTPQGRMLLLVVGASVLSACSAALPTAENPTAIPQIGPEISPGLSFGAIPTPEGIVGPEGEIQYPTEIYCAPHLKICVAHQFDKNGNPLDPAILTSSETVADLSNNKVVLTGDLVAIPTDGYGEIETDIDASGNTIPVDGYVNRESTVMTAQAARELIGTMDLNDQGRAAVEAVLQEVEAKGLDVNIDFRQILNKTIDPSGVEKLVDMDEKLWLRAGDEGTLAILEDKLEPFDKVELLSDMQIAGVEVVNRVGEIDEFVMEVYPSDWIEVGGGSWVSPEFFELQSQIAASGERLTLLPNGTIQDGATVVPGLFVDKNGTITLQVGGENVTLDPADVIWSDENGFLPKGYTLDEATGLWEPAQEIIDIGGNLSVILGEKVEGGTLIDSFVADPSLTPEQQTEKLKQTDYTEQLGFPAGSLEWMKTDAGDTALVRADDHNRIVGWWMRSEITNRTSLILNGVEFVNNEGIDPYIFSVGRTWDANTVYGNELKEMQLSLGKITNNDVSDWVSTTGGIDKYRASQTSISSNDGKRILFGVFVTVNNDVDLRLEAKNGILFFQDAEDEDWIRKFELINFDRQ